MTGYTRGVSKTSYNEVQIKDEDRYVWVMMVAKQAYAEYLLCVRLLCMLSLLILNKLLKERVLSPFT